MAKVVVGIGIPGSGKSTALRAFAEKHGYTYICPDDIRAEISGDAADQSRNKEVWELAYKRTQDSLREGKDVVFDSTQTVGRYRSELIQKLREWGADKVAGLFSDTELSIAKERNASRERKVPDEVLERMQAGLDASRPDTKDGFDAVFTLDENQELKAASIVHGEMKLTKQFK